MKYFGHHVRSWSRREREVLVVTVLVVLAVFLLKDVVFGAPSVTVTPSTPLTLPVNTYCNMTTYVCSFNVLTVEAGATVTVNGDPVSGKHVVINATTVTVQSGGKITADGKGYGPGQGPGAGANNTNLGGIAPGGGHGGSGGRTDYFAFNGGSPNDFVLLPSNFGSGGGDVGGNNVGGAGGGFIDIVASTNIVLDGTITANGDAGRFVYGGPQPFRAYVGGGGSGGTIQLAARTLTGGGTLTANGGAAGAFQSTVAGSGAGGVIKITLSRLTALTSGQAGYEANDPIHNIFYPLAGMIGRIKATAGSGTGWQVGEDGAVALYASNYRALLMLGQAYISRGGFPTGTATDPITVTSLGVGTDLITPPGANVWLAKLIETDSATPTAWVVTSRSIFHRGILTTQGNNQNINFGRGVLWLENGSRIQPSYFDKRLTNGQPTNEHNATGINSAVNITATSVVLSADSRISTYRTGSVAANGAGAPTALRAGAGYGGLGGLSEGLANSGGPIYGGDVANTTHPTLIGSGGANGPFSGIGGRGGGVLSLVASSTLTNNGLIEGNGQPGTNYAGGGSGGSVYVQASSITGTGSITTTGGAGGAASAGNGAGGGAGGRLAVLYAACSWSNHSLSAAGGAGSWAGGNGQAGSVYYQSTRVPSAPTVNRVIHSEGTWTTGPTNFPLGSLTFRVNRYTGCNRHLATTYPDLLNSQIHWELRLAGQSTVLAGQTSVVNTTSTNSWTVDQSFLTDGGSYVLSVWYSDVAGTGTVRTFTFDIAADPATILTIDGRDPEAVGARYDDWPPTDIPPHTVLVDGVDSVDGELPFELVGSSTGSSTWFFSEFESWNPGNPEAGKISEWTETSSTNVIRPTRDAGADQFKDLTHWYLVRYTPVNQPGNVSPYYYFTFTPTQPPWLQVRGDIYSGGGVTLTTPPSGEASALYCVSAVGAVAITPGDTEFVDCQRSGLPPIPFPKKENNYFSQPFGRLDPDQIMARANDRGRLITGCTLPSRLEGQVYWCDAPGGATLNASTLTDGTTYGHGTLIVRGDLTITGNITYAPTTAPTSNQLASLGVMVVKRADGTGGNLYIAPAVTQLVGAYYAEDTVYTCSGSGSCSASPLVVRGVMAAHRFQFQRTFVSFEDIPAEQFMADGRALANVPPGFEQFIQGLPDWRP